MGDDDDDDVFGRSDESHCSPWDVHLPFNSWPTVHLLPHMFSNIILPSSFIIPLPVRPHVGTLSGIAHFAISICWPRCFSKLGRDTIAWLFHFKAGYAICVKNYCNKQSDAKEKKRKSTHWTPVKINNIDVFFFLVKMGHWQLRHVITSMFIYSSKYRLLQTHTRARISAPAWFTTFLLDKWCHNTTIYNSFISRLKEQQQFDGSK